MFQRLYLLALPAAAALAVIAALALAEPATVAPSEGVLLLRTGRVLAGKIRREGDRYFVILPLGEIRVRADEVEHVSATLADGYEYKRATILPGSAGPHLDLVAWCIANELWAEAQRELDEARRLEPRHPKIPLIERRLATDRQNALEPRPASTPKVAEPDASPAEDDDDAPPAVSKAALESFTTTVQPILQNHCSAAACHGPSAPSSFRLVRLPYGRPTNQRTTQQNLRAVLRLVDREHPSQSPLLMMPIKPHGKAKDAVFKARDNARYRHLVAWVNQVTGGTAGVSEGAGPEKQPPLLQAKAQGDVSASGPQKGPKAVKPAGFQMPNQPPTPGERSSEGTGGRSLPQGANPQGFVPRDAFDPEIFNRRHFPGRVRP